MAARRTASLGTVQAAFSRARRGVAQRGGSIQPEINARRQLGGNSAAARRRRDVDGALGQGGWSLW